MDLTSFFGRGAAHAPKPKHSNKVLKSAEAARRQWLNALLVDQTRAWMDIGESQPEVLRGLGLMLTAAGFAHAFDARNVDTPEINVIRGAISTIEACGHNDSVITEQAARTLSLAATRATELIQAASVDAILHAALSLRNLVGDA